MLICVACKREMRCDKNEVGAEFNPGVVYPSDRFACPQCGVQVLDTNLQPIHDPMHQTQVEYLTGVK